LLSELGGVMAFEDDLNKLCDIYSDASTQGSSGFLNLDQTLREANVPCAKRKLKDSEIFDYGKRGIEATDRFYFCDEWNFNSTDMIRFEGAEYRVVQIDNIGMLDEFWQIDCQKKPSQIVGGS
jgi:hypothetical protein